MPQRTLSLIGHVVILMVLGLIYYSCALDESGSVAVTVTGVIAFIGAFIVLFRTLNLIASAARP